MVNGLKLTEVYMSLNNPEIQVDWQLTRRHHRRRQW
jgi:hypothetical protein